MKLATYINSKNNKSIIKKLIQTKKVRSKIIKLKQDVDKYIVADEDYIKLKQKVEYLKTICDYLDKTIKQISNRGFLIKDAIEWRKFTSGAI